MKLKISDETIDNLVVDILKRDLKIQQKMMDSLTEKSSLKPYEVQDFADCQRTASALVEILAYYGHYVTVSNNSGVEEGPDR